MIDAFVKTGLEQRGAAVLFSSPIRVVAVE
jgi:hypothetical protein